MNDYKEQEIKVLDIDVVSVVKKLESIGAKKVYDGVRTIFAVGYFRSFLFDITRQVDSDY